MIPVSAVIITLNEAENIERTIKALDFCDEIVVIDSGSIDNTVELCRQLHCKVLYRAFDNYGLQKRFAVEQASNNWVLVIDADEVVTPALKQEITTRFSGNDLTVQGFYLPFSLLFLNHTFRFSGQNRQLHLRLFNKQFGTINTNAVHEGVAITGKTACMHNVILHYSYKSLSDYFEKFNRYTSAAGEHVCEKGTIKSKPNTMLRVPITFFKIYLCNLGFLDGYAGFVWALLSSLYPLVKYAKARECFEKNHVYNS